MVFFKEILVEILGKFSEENHREILEKVQKRRKSKQQIFIEDSEEALCFCF